MCYTPPLLPAGTDSCLLRDTSVPRMVLVQLPCNLQGQTVVFSGIHLSSKSCHTPPLDRQFALTGIHLSARRRCTPSLPPVATDECHFRVTSVPKKCCTPPLPPAGTDECLLRDTSVPKKRFTPPLLPGGADSRLVRDKPVPTKSRKIYGG